MFRAGLHLCGLVIFLALEDSIFDDQIVFRAKTQKKFTVEQHFLTPSGPITRGHLSTFPTLTLKSPAIISLSVKGTFHRTFLRLLQNSSLIPSWLVIFGAKAHSYGGVHISLQRKSHGDDPVADRYWILFQLLSNGVPYCKTFSTFSSLSFSCHSKKSVQP